MCSLSFASTLDMDEKTFREFRETCHVSHTILYRPGTRLCIGTPDDIRELEEARAEQEAAANSGVGGSGPHASYHQMNRTSSTPRGVRPSVLLTPLNVE